MQQSLVPRAAQLFVKICGMHAQRVALAQGSELVWASCEVPVSTLVPHSCTGIMHPLLKGASRDGKGICWNLNKKMGVQIYSMLGTVDFYIAQDIEIDCSSTIRNRQDVDYRLGGAAQSRAQHKATPRPAWACDDPNIVDYIL